MRRVRFWMASLVLLLGSVALLSSAAIGDARGSRETCGASALPPQPPSHPPRHVPLEASRANGPPRAEPVGVAFSRGKGRDDSVVATRPEVAEVRQAMDPQCGETFWEVVLSDGTRFGVPFKPTHVSTTDRDVVIRFR